MKWACRELSRIYLIQTVHTDRVGYSFVHLLINSAKYQDLDIRIIAEGVETQEEYLSLERMGISLFQGFYFARPVFEGLGQVDPNLFSRHPNS